MDTQLENRLVELRAEYESGQKILKDIELKIAELENRKKALSETLLRISGAIDLLEEVLGKNEGTPAQGINVSPEVSGENVEVPNVVRQTLEKAKETLKEAGLSTGEVVEQKGVFPVGIMSGEVLRQEPKPGVKVLSGSPVKLVVASRGKFMPPLDDRSMCESFSDRG